MSEVLQNLPLPEIFGPNQLGCSEFIDRLEGAMQEYGPCAPAPLVHRFTPGLYIREITMAPGTLVTSRIHRFEHPFTISKGRVSVWAEEGGSVEYTAPHTGITKAGTRRVLYVHEETVWSTYHVTNETDVAKIESMIIEPHFNPHLTGGALPCLSGE